MFLPYMVRFMPEDLFAKRAIPIQLVIPEDVVQERKWSARLMRPEKMDIAHFSLGYFLISDRI